MTQPIRQLARVLAAQADADHYVFTADDLRGVVPGQSRDAFIAMISRAERDGLLERICRGVYLVPDAHGSDGLVLYHAARKLRADQFNYISLETALSDAGVISQIPMSWITIMSSGRTNTVDCGRFGSIEFIHTKKRPENLVDLLTYDDRCRMWRASVPLAIQDMKNARRDTDLIDWNAVDESV